jgi:ABC-2 type transport system ATP-binding protein
MLIIKDFIKQYPGTLTPVLEIPYLSLDHSLYWLKGVNGSGKSSLIRALAGISPFKGTVSLNGLNPRKNRMAFRLAMNHAEAEPVYPGFLSGNDLVAFYSSTKKASKKQSVEMIDRLAMSSYIGNKISVYSSGMLKKLSLALAFLGNPQWILLDEPFITLDSIALNEVLQIMKEFAVNERHILIASHQEPEAMDQIECSLLEIKDRHIIPLYARID